MLLKKKILCEVVGIVFLWERKDGSMGESFSMHITQMCSEVVLHGYLRFEDMHIILLPGSWYVLAGSMVLKQPPDCLRNSRTAQVNGKKKAQVCMWHF